MLIYGFGSFFKSMASYHDIDLLIVHDSITKSSCLKAISLKKILLNEVSQASVTVLSKSAEKHFDFIKASEAVLLGMVDEGDSELFIEEIVQNITRFR